MSWVKKVLGSKEEKSVEGGRQGEKESIVWGKEGWKQGRKEG